MPERTIVRGTVCLEFFDERAVGPDPAAWLAKHAKPGMILLAHADDGVLWGRAMEGGFQWPPSDVHPQAAWRAETLQMARLFDDTREIMVWRTGEGAWRARSLTDGTGKSCETLDEAQVMWGTRTEATGGGFTRVTDGEQGLRHAVPLSLPDHDWDSDRPLRLGVRHYLTRDDQGWVRVAKSRLTGLWRKETP